MKKYKNITKFAVKDEMCGMSAEPVSGLRPATLLLTLLCPASHGLHQVYPVEVLLLGLHPLPAQLRHLHGDTGVLARGEVVVPQCLVDIVGFSKGLQCDNSDRVLRSHWSSSVEALL